MPFSPLVFFAGAFITWYIQHAVQKRRQRQDDKAFAEQHGCEPPPHLKNQRPFGLDRLEQIFRAAAESRLMELFLFHFRQTGNTLEQCLLGTPAFGTIDPENMEAILSTNLKDWGIGQRREIAGPMFGEGIFIQEDDAWKHSRSILRPQFTHKQYDDLQVFDESVNDLLDLIPEKGVVNLQPLFFRMTLDVTTSFLFGESVRSLRSPESAGEQTFAEAFNTAQDYVARRFRLQDLYWLVGGSGFKKACNDLNNFADQVIDRALRQNGEPGDEKDGTYAFLKALAKEIPDRVTLRGAVINILAAGRDTTACLLSWTFFLLVRHPNVLEKLCAEVEEAFEESTKLNRSDLRGMSYLQNVLKETLRLYPSLPVNSRIARNRTVLPTGGGPDRKSPVFIPKGTVLAYSVYSMHRRPDIYGLDAELFRPERWDEDMPLKQNPVYAKWGYLPFNGGPRICLGMDFALTEAAYVVARILRRFPSIRLPKGENVELVGVEKQTMTLVVSVTEGCNVETY